MDMDFVVDIKCMIENFASRRYEGSYYKELSKTLPLIVVIQQRCNVGCKVWILNNCPLLWCVPVCHKRYSSGLKWNWCQ